MNEGQDIRDCVVFLCSAKDQFVGTAFLVGVVSESKKYSFPYLVTAKHVAEKYLTNKPFLVRMNDNKGSFQYIPIEATKWHSHPSDETADVAVLPFGFDAKTFDFKMIRLDMFVDDDMIKGGQIIVTDEVWISGLFGYASGSRRNMPITRMGNIAMIPNEPLQIKREKETVNMEVYLIEARSIGGISGSPVFVRTRKTRKMSLLGMMYGHWKVDPKTLNDVYPIPDNNGVNIGIAVVSPAKKILETLFRPELIELRKKEDSELL